MISLREFVRLPFLRNDLGDPIQRTELLDRVVDAYSRGPGTTAVCTLRQQGKSTVAALLTLYEFLTQRKSYVVWLAGGSREQATAVVVQKLTGWLRRPAVREALRWNMNVSRTRLENLDLGTVVEVLTTSEASAPGRRVSLLIADESRSVDEQLIGVVRPALATGGRAVYLGSPGSPGSWWHRAVRAPEPEDVVIEIADLVNPVVSREFVEAERRRLSKTVLGSLLSAREWDGVWTAITEHPLLRPSDVAAASRDQVEPHRAGEVTYCGVDLSLTRDKTSVVVVAVGDEGYLRIIHKWCWDPTTQGAVDLEKVERQVETVHRRFRPRAIQIDAYQGVLLSQRLRRRGVRIEAVPVTLDLNQRIFETLAELLSEGRLTWRKDEALERELLGLELKERSTGRFSIVDSDKRYHRDVAFSLALAVAEAAGRPRSGLTVHDVNRWTRPGLDPARLEVADGRPWHCSSRELVPVGRRVDSA